MSPHFLCYPKLYNVFHWLSSHHTDGSFCVCFGLVDFSLGCSFAQLVIVKGERIHQRPLAISMKDLETVNILSLSPPPLKMLGALPNYTDTPKHRYIRDPTSVRTGETLCTYTWQLLLELRLFALSVPATLRGWSRICQYTKEWGLAFTSPHFRCLSLPYSKLIA